MRSDGVGTGLERHLVDRVCELLWFVFDLDVIGRGRVDVDVAGGKTAELNPA
jgi:hypothetical protein